MYTCRSIIGGKQSVSCSMLRSAKQVDSGKASALSYLPPFQILRNPNYNVVKIFEKCQHKSLTFRPKSISYEDIFIPNSQPKPSATMNNLLTDSFEIPRGQTSKDGDIELGLQVPSSSELGLGGFNKQVEDIGKQIDKLTELLKKLQDANEESKAVTKAASMKAIKQSMEKDINEVMKIARSAKVKLEELNKDNLINRQMPGCGEGSSVDRMRITSTLALQKKLKDKLSEFQALREKIKKEYHEVVERRVFTVTGNHADEQTINQLIETGNSEEIFQRAIQDQGRGQIMDTLAELHERHDAVKEIERKLLELHEIFRDISVLVDTQQDVLNDIQTNVENARGYVDNGIQALSRARKLQKNSRKCICCSIIFLLIIALIVVLSLHPWN